MLTHAYFNLMSEVTVTVKPSWLWWCQMSCLSQQHCNTAGVLVWRGQILTVVTVFWYRDPGCWCSNAFLHFNRSGCPLTQDGDPSVSSLALHSFRLLVSWSLSWMMSLNKSRSLIRLGVVYLLFCTLCHVDISSICFRFLLKHLADTFSPGVTYRALRTYQYLCSMRSKTANALPNKLLYKNDIFFCKIKLIYSSVAIKWSSWVGRSSWVHCIMGYKIPNNRFCYCVV